MTLVGGWLLSTLVAEFNYQYPRTLETMIQIDGVSEAEGVSIGGDTPE